MRELVVYFKDGNTYVIKDLRKMWIYWDNFFEEFILEYEDALYPNRSIVMNREKSKLEDIKFQIAQAYAKGLNLLQI